MRQRDADRIIDRRRAREGRVETLPVHLPHELEPDLAWDLPVEFAPGEFATGLAADMDREGGRGIVEKLLGMVVRKHDPEIWAFRLQPITDVASNLLPRRNALFRLRVGLREKLWCMRQDGAADDRRVAHACLSRLGA